jgi:hypothetical protein
MKGKSLLTAGLSHQLLELLRDHSVLVDAVEAGRGSGWLK